MTIDELKAKAGSTMVAREVAAEAASIAKRTTGEDPTDAFRNQGLRGSVPSGDEGSLWIFTEHYFLEFHEFPSLSTWDVMRAESLVRVFYDRREAQRSDGGFTTLVVGADTVTGVTCTWKAIGDNCENLMEIVSKHVVPKMALK